MLKKYNVEIQETIFIVIFQKENLESNISFTLKNLSNILYNDNIKILNICFYLQL